MKAKWLYNDLGRNTSNVRMPPFLAESPRLKLMSLFGFVLTIMALGCAPHTSGEQASSSRTPLSKSRVDRTVRLPATVTSGVLSRSGQIGKELTIVAGAEDELPGGPQAFDVLPDGTFVVTDPFNERLVLFGSEGGYRSHVAIGFSAGEVTARGANQFLALKTNSDEMYLIEGKRVELLADVEAKRLRGPDASARLVGPTRGEVDVPQGSGQPPRSIPVQISGGELRLVSIQNLGTDSGGNTYVVLEVTRGGEAIELSKLIRKYRKDGSLTTEISNIPIDYYVHPTVEFRIKNGVVYQLMPMRAEVDINVWTTE